MWCIFIQKLKRRKAALNLSSNWNENEKAQIKIGLVPEAMSPENSEDKPASPGHTEDSDEELGRPAQKNTSIVTSPLGWRSQQFTDMLQSLDHKWMRRCSERSRTMIKKRRNGPATTDIAEPEGIPQ